MHRETRHLWRPGLARNTAPTGSGLLPTTCGRLAATSSWTAWDRPETVAGCSSPRSACRRDCLRRDGLTPLNVVQPDFLLGALFVRSAYCHYYFGDYFDAGYGHGGFVPWFDYRIGKGTTIQTSPTTVIATATTVGRRTCAATTQAAPAATSPGRRARSSSRTRSSITLRPTSP